MSLDSCTIGSIKFNLILKKPAGEYEVEFNGAYFPSGIYFYQLKAGQHSKTRKMVLIK
jgi:hypothetical protein